MNYSFLPLNELRSLLQTTQSAYYTVYVLCAIGMLISTLEYLVVIKQFRPEGIYSWNVLSTQSRRVRSQWLAKVINTVLDYPGIKYMIALRLIALITLLAFYHNYTIALLSIIVIASTTLLFNYRQYLGTDGSDQMNSILLVTMLLYFLLPGHSTVATMGLWFITLQACISYSAAGISKLASPKWRRGEAIFQVMNTATYGTKWIATYLRDKPRVNLVLAWSVMLIETFFPLCLFLPLPFMLLFLAWGFSFHLYNALFMGLNSFFWSFFATYPALVFCSLAITA